MSGSLQIISGGTHTFTHVQPAPRPITPAKPFCFPSIGHRCPQRLPSPLKTEEANYPGHSPRPAAPILDLLPLSASHECRAPDYRSSSDPALTRGPPQEPEGSFQRDQLPQGIQLRLHLRMCSRSVWTSVATKGQVAGPWPRLPGFRPTRGHSEQ